jgi:hypothetical protein
MTAIELGECRETDVYAKDCPALVRVLGEKATLLGESSSLAPTWISQCFKTEGCVAELELAEEQTNA